MNIDIISPQVLILSILVLVGAIGSKVGVISVDAKDMLAKIVFVITLPLMLLCNFIKLNITPGLLSNSLAIIVLLPVIIRCMGKIVFIVRTNS